MTVSHKWEELTSAQLADRLAADPECVALIPVGATEQHGPHLPVGTDTIIATSLADVAAGENLQITQLTSSGNALRPAISPDGKYILNVMKMSSIGQTCPGPQN